MRRRWLPAQPQEGEIPVESSLAVQVSGGTKKRTQVLLHLLLHISLTWKVLSVLLSMKMALPRVTKLSDTSSSRRLTFEFSRAYLEQRIEQYPTGVSHGSGRHPEITTDERAQQRKSSDRRLGIDIETEMVGDQSAQQRKVSVVFPSAPKFSPMLGQ